MSLNTCAASALDQPCTAAATLTDPVLLCDEHKLQVAMAVVPDMLTGALREARAVASRTLKPDVAHMVASAQSAPLPTTDAHSALVYFMANGGRVKIGYTKSLFSRISALSLREEAVLLLLHGGTDLERALHAKFGAHRVADSEWFELAPDVVHFIASKAPKHRTGGSRRPTRANAARKSRRPTKAVSRAVAKEAIADLYGSLGRRPREGEMTDVLKALHGYPHTSRQHANKLRGEIERERPDLAALGSDNVLALTGS